MRLHTFLLSSLLLAGLACTRPPPDPPGLEQQRPTTPKTPAQEPTVTPPGSAQDEWPASEPIGPGHDDPDIVGGSVPTVGTPDPREAAPY